MLCRSLLSRALRRSTQHKLLHTCAPLCHATSAAPVSPASSTKSLLQKYGYYPIGALATAMAFSKEIIIVDAELLVLGTFTFTVYALYTQIGGVVANMLDDRAKRIEKEMLSAMDDNIEAIDEQIESFKKYLTLSDDVDAIYAQQINLLERYSAALPIKMGSEISNQISNRLSVLYEKEQEVSNKMQISLADSATESVRQIFVNANANVKMKLWSNALQELKTGQVADGQDLVQVEFAQYLSSFTKKVEQDKGKQIQLDDKLKTMWDDSVKNLKRLDPHLEDLKVDAPSSITL